MSPSSPVVSTAGLDVEDRVAFWEDWNTRSLFGLRCTTLRPELDLTSVQRASDALTVTEVSGSPHLVERSRAAIARADHESVVLTALVHGSGYFHSAAGTAVMRPGDAMVYSTASPHVFCLEEHLRLVMVSVPTALLHGDWDVTAPPEPRPLPRSATAALLAATATMAGAGQEASAQRLARVSRDLLLGSGGPSEASLHARALAVIRTRLSDPELTAEAVAGAVGVSSRHLNRVFSTMDPDRPSVGRAVRAARLDGAVAELGTRADLSVTDIASRWGFSSPAHLARACRRQTGRSPSELRDPAARTAAQTGCTSG